MIKIKQAIKTKDLLITRNSSAENHEKLSHSHCHDDFEILYITEGEGRCIIEGSAFDIRPNTLILIKPLEYHHVELFSNTPYDRYVIHFKETCLIEECQNIMHAVCNDHENGCRYYTSQDITENIVSAFDKLFFSESLVDEDKIIYTKIILSELIFFIARLKGNRIERDEEELGTKLVRYLNDHLTKELSLDKLAKRFFVSKYYLCRVFKKHNGVSIHGYINQKRVMYAKQLIESGETASGAAYRVGFGDYSAFYRAYVKIIGKSPTSS